MTDLLDRALAKARSLPPDMQDDIARLIVAYAGDHGPVIQLTPEEESDLAKAEAEADRGEFATEEDVGAIFAKYKG